MHASRDDTRSTRSPLILFFLVGLIPLYWYGIRPHLSIFQSTPVAVDTTPGPSDWFLTVKLPEAPHGAQEAQAYKTRLDSWLAAVQHAGFHPMLLSEAEHRIQGHVGLPNKTLVLVFEPGYRTTYDVIGETLARHRTPAVWITNAAAVKRSNRQYVSNYRIWLMKRSGLWDIGFYQGPSVLTLQSNPIGTLTLKSSTGAFWSTAAVTQALNQGRALDGMHRLKADIQWSDEELVGRLLNEVPLHETSQLTALQIGERAWGIATQEVSLTNSLLSLKAPLDKRATSVSWPGTQGIHNFKLQIDVPSLTGELWVLLRSDHENNDSIRLGFTPDAVLLEKEEAGQRIHLMTGNMRIKNHFTTEVTLRDDTLDVIVNDRSVLRTSSLPPSKTNKTMLDVMIYSRIRGTASLNGARLLLTPTSHGSPSGQSNQP